MEQPTPVKAKPKVKKEYIFAVGRRKVATARVRLFNKQGDLLVNGIPAGKYFPGVLSTARYLLPFKTVGAENKMSFSAKVVGSGKKAQLDAVVHGLARALDILNKEKYHSLLKAEGLLTRDSRMKESRKVGMGGKSRRKKQSPKR